MDRSNMNKDEIQKIINEVVQDLNNEGMFDDLKNKFKDAFKDTNVKKLVRDLKKDGFKLERYRTIKNIDLMKDKVKVTVLPYKGDWALLINFQDETGVGPEGTKVVRNVNQLSPQELEKVHQELLNFSVGAHGFSPNSKAFKIKQRTRRKLNDKGVFETIAPTMKKSELQSVVNEVVSEVFEEFSGSGDNGGTPIAYAVAIVNNHIFPHSGEELEKLAKQSHLAVRFVGAAAEGTENLSSYRAVFGGPRGQLDSFIHNMAEEKGIEFHEIPVKGVRPLKEVHPRTGQMKFNFDRGGHKHSQEPKDKLGIGTWTKEELEKTDYDDDEKDAIFKRMMLAIDSLNTFLNSDYEKALKTYMEKDDLEPEQKLEIVQNMLVAINRAPYMPPRHIPRGTFNLPEKPSSNPFNETLSEIAQTGWKKASLHNVTGDEWDAWRTFAAQATKKDKELESVFFTAVARAEDNPDHIGTYTSDRYRVDVDGPHKAYRVVKL